MNLLLLSSLGANAKPPRDHVSNGGTPLSPKHAGVVSLSPKPAVRAVSSSAQPPSLRAPPSPPASSSTRSCDTPTAPSTPAYSSFGSRAESPFVGPHHTPPPREMRSDISSATGAPRVYCSEAGHEDQELRYYCLDCQSPICSDCAVLAHLPSGHRSKPLMEAFRTAKNEISGLVAGVQVHEEQIAAAISAIEQVDRRVTEKKDELLHVIDERFAHFAAELELRKQALVKEFLTFYQRKHDTLQRQINTHTGEKQSLGAARTQSEQCFDSGKSRNPARALQLLKDIRQRLSFLSQGKLEYRPLETDRICCQLPASLHDVLTGLGRVFDGEPVAARCVLVGEGLKRAKLDGADNEFIIEARNSTGELCAGGLDADRFKVISSDPALTVHVEPSETGRYRCSYRVGKATRFQISVTFDESHINPSPCTIVTPFRYKFGSKGFSAGQFSAPVGIAVCPVTGSVYVADYICRLVQVFNSHGTFMHKAVVSGLPHGVCMLPARSSSAVDSPSHVVVSCTDTTHVLDGKLRAVTTAPNRYRMRGLSKPSGVALFDGELYIVESGKHRVVITDDEGMASHSFGSYGAEPGELNLPECIGISPNGEVFVGEVDGARISIFDVHGKFLRIIAIQAPVYGIAVNQSLVAVALGAQGVRILAHDGVVMANYSLSGADLGQFADARGICWGQQNSLFVTDCGNGCIQVFQP